MDETENKQPEAGTGRLSMSFREAREHGFYSYSNLHSRHLRPLDGPVGTIRAGKRSVKVYDINRTEPVTEEEAAADSARRFAARSLHRCSVCGGMTGSENEICHKCAQAAKNRAESDLYEAEKARAARMDPAKQVFLDLEMTGDSRADEILSVSMTDGNGKVLLDSLVHPLVAKSWPFTVKIHHITPKMVRNCPTVTDLEPEILRILSEADEILGYSISNDWKYLKALPTVAPIAEELHGKVRCCQMFFDRFVKTDMPALETGKRSLSVAMTSLGLDWDGKAHSSLADTLACAAVWRRLFLERDMIRLPEPEPAPEDPEDDE